MRKHPIVGVLALATALAVVLISGAAPLYASQRTAFTGASGECCVLVNGVCVPCDGVTTGTSRSTSATRFATVRVIEAARVSGSVACDPSNCEPMTAEECAALGCDPGQCAGSSGLSTDTRMINSAAAQKPTASGCGGVPCGPSTGCGAGSGCARTSNTEI